MLKANRRWLGVDDSYYFLGRPSSSVVKMIARANDVGLAQEIQEDVSCCFAVQDTTWVKRPENDWALSYVKGEAPSMSCGIGDTATGWAEGAEPVLETVPAAKSECC